MRQTQIVRSRVRHKIGFAFNSKGAQPASLFIESRLVRDLKEIPTNVKRITLYDVVENAVVVTGKQGSKGPGSWVCTTPINIELFYVAHTAEDAQQMRTKGFCEITVNSILKGRVWVFGNEQQADEQQAA